MENYTDKELRILLSLSDEKGHSISELASSLEDHTGSIQNSINNLLIKKKTISQAKNGEPATLTESKINYYIVNDIDVFESIINGFYELKQNYIDSKQRSSYKFQVNDLRDGNCLWDLHESLDWAAIQKINTKSEDQISLEIKLMYSKDPLSKYINDNLSKKTIDDLSRYRNKSRNPKMRPIIERDLVAELNGLLDDENLYDPQRFNHVNISIEIKKLIEKKPKNKDLNRLNRILLEEAYPLDILSLRTPFSALEYFIYTDYVEKIIKEAGFWIVFEILKTRIESSELLSFVDNAVNKNLATKDERAEILNEFINKGLIRLV
jgi:hypothetical protein